MTRVAKPAPKRPEEGSSVFTSKPLMMKKSELIAKQNKKDGSASDRPKRIRSARAKDKRAERRRMFRKIDKEKSFTCFLCRQKGHSIKNCPKAESDTAVDICYHCGSNEHTTKNCATPNKSFSFATCFVCGVQGHLASACEKNDKGLYPDGGGCKYCGSTQHLMKDCKPASNRDGDITVGTVDAYQGGDDDDVFVALRRQQVDKDKQGNGNGDPSGASGSKKQMSKKPKKVVVNF